MTCLRVKITHLSPTETTTCRYIAGLDASQTIGNLATQLLEAGEEPSKLHITCIYYGEILDLNKKLSDYDIDPYSILQFVIKPAISGLNCSAEPIESGTVKRVSSALAGIRRSGRLNEFISFISNRDLLDLLIQKNALIGSDSVVYSILLDCKLLDVILNDRNSLSSLLLTRPAMAVTLRCGIETFRKSKQPQTEATIWNADPARKPFSGDVQDFSIDRNDEDTEEEEEEDGEIDDQVSTAPTFLTPYGGPVSISQQALQAALAQASSSRRNAPSNPVSSSESQTRSHATGITPDMFSQALQTSTEQAAAVPEPSHQWDEHLATLRDMGVTDEQIARQALEAAGGDLALAIQILFG